MQKSHIKKIAIVDDHSLFASSLASLVNSFEDCEVHFVANNGEDFKEQLLDQDAHPDVVLLDINMPILNGPETLHWIQSNHPQIHVLALSMDDGESTILKMLRLGAKGYLLKDIQPDILEQAIQEVVSEGYFYTQDVSKVLLKSVQGKHLDSPASLTNRELEFVKLSCSEMTYKEIADTMDVSPKTVDGYRDSVFTKFDLKNRVGLVLFAMKHKIFQV